MTKKKRKNKSRINNMSVTNNAAKIIKTIQPAKRAASKAVKLSTASAKLDEAEEIISQSIEATPDIFEAIGELKKLDDMKKILLEKEDALKAKVMNYMQLYIELKLGAITIATWKSCARSHFDLQAFKNEFPDLYGSYTREINVRIFRIL